MQAQITVFLLFVQTVLMQTASFHCHMLCWGVTAKLVKSEQEEKSVSLPHGPLWLSYNKRFDLHSKPKSNEMQSSGEPTDESPLKASCVIFSKVKILLLSKYNQLRLILKCSDTKNCQSVPTRTKRKQNITHCSISLRCQLLAKLMLWVWGRDNCLSKHGPQTVLETSLK